VTQTVFFFHFRWGSGHC